jgi:hypothetical protein
MPSITMSPILLLIAGMLFITAVARWPRQRWLRYPFAALGLLSAGVGGYLFWFEHRTVPAAANEAWFEGVRYQRIIRSEPRPLVIHFVTVDLDNANIGFLVTPPMNQDSLPLVGKTTSAFLREHRLQVAINGSFFSPWHSRGPWDYYPHAGDPVGVHGFAISNGKPYCKRESGYHALFLTKENKAFIGDDCKDAWQAISGREIFVKNGKYTLDAKRSAPYGEPEPRTAFALSEDERKLLLFVVDGRQPNYSEGVSIAELAAIIVEHGGATALHMDGGGSSTLVRADERGEPIVVNSPIHGRHPPGRERPIANHLGVFAKGR